jgi:cysteine-S-conjugate beta-lyase
VKFATRLLNFDPAPGDRFTPANTPIYQTATFRQDDATEFGEYDYSRSGNPTRAVVEKQIAALESGTRGFCFATGLAAITAVTRLVSPGEEILACDDLYGGTYRLFSRILAKRGINVRYADFTNLAALAASISEKTKLVYLESPTNPLLQIIDIAAVCEIAHRSSALVCVDNSTMSPYLQRPLELGADIVLHSATKFLCGHSDVMAGAVVVADHELAAELYLIQNGEGAGLAPFDSFLLLRGMKTLSLRLDRQQANASKIAEFLAAHPAVDRVYYPGLPPQRANQGRTGGPGLADERQLAIHRSQASGDGAVLSFVTGDPELSRAVVEATKLFNIAVSFGGVNSTISLPNYMSHASIPAHLRQQKSIPADLVRVSVGAEDADDLVDDLSQAFEIASRQTNALRAIAAD